VKSKALTYGLGAAAIAIWVGVSITVYNTLNSSAVHSAVDVAAVNNQVHHNTVADSFSIVADYADPFLSIPYTNSVEVKESFRPKRPFYKPKPKAAKNKVSWSHIKYMGLFTNKRNGKMMAILKQNGREEMMNIGDTSGDLELVEISSDSILVSYQKELKYIHLNH